LGGPQSQPVLELASISKTYGHLQALADVSFELLPGEIHALVGDNGAGKSTLLKVAAGAVQPDSGQVLVRGAPVVLASPGRARELGIEMVYQDLALAQDRSSMANVFVGREILRAGILGRLGYLNREQMALRTRDAFAALAITISDVARPVRLLSGGQRQGVAVARAAMWARQVVLMDEPAAALGVRQRETVNQLVAGLREKGFGVLLVSHNIPEVLRIADRITILRLGRVLWTKPAAALDTKEIVIAMMGGITA
jgi:simple sugar transport system ATP-binding protein